MGDVENEALKTAWLHGEELLQTALAELEGSTWSQQAPSLAVLRDWLIERGFSLPLEGLAGALYRYWLLGKTHRPFSSASEPFDPDDVSRIVVCLHSELLVLANAAVWPFQTTFPPAARPFLDRLARHWAPGALDQAFYMAAEGWRATDIPTLTLRYGEGDSEFDPHLEALAVEVSPRGVHYVSIGTQGALQIRGGSIVARTPLDDLRTLRGLQGPLADIVARTLSEDTPSPEPHRGELELLPGDGLALFPGSALRRAPGLPFSPETAEAFRLEHRLPYTVAIRAGL
jgi:hypothetical protein